jgi:hypothetical protein
MIRMDKNNCSHEFVLHIEAVPIQSDMPLNGKNRKFANDYKKAFKCVKCGLIKKTMSILDDDDIIKKEDERNEDIENFSLSECLNSLYNHAYCIDYLCCDEKCTKRLDRIANRIKVLFEEVHNTSIDLNKEFKVGDKVFINSWTKTEGIIRWINSNNTAFVTIDFKNGIVQGFTFALSDLEIIK